ncbi:MAG: type II secretion system F family protein [Candidatus Moranbacteria bacterium]|jgi:type II secretory pathway component PulF|nr:type II secretion system F family protein [Candidatus Moranbacteria bacterium]MDD5652338.1 type II secretion system F family protein [Candidatus Moranbacteria bacterium]MDX9855388.1 type II secretion system F family protein [Candidatus Moranbacteria bacterium]
MRFTFKAKDLKGKVRKGVINAVDRELAVQILRENKLNPISVEKETGDSFLNQYFSKTWERVDKKDLVVFFRQFHALIGSKVPVVYSLRAIADQSEHRYLSSAVKDVANDVEDGTTLSSAMKKYPDVFPNVSTSVIEAGEISGNLEEAIEYVAKNTEKNYRTTAKIKGALIYPAFVTAVAIVVGFFSVTFIVPKLTQVIEDINAEVPWHTQLIINIGNFMESYWWAVLIVIFGAVIGMFYYMKTESGKKEWDKIQLDLPVFGKLLRYLYITRFTSNLTVLLEGGVPIVQSLETVSRVVNNSVYQGIILRCGDEVKTGGTISSVLTQSEYIPGIVAKMVKVGEETGKITESLDNVGKFYEQEMDEMIKNMSSLIEPILIIGLGIAVAIMAFSIILPIYGIVQQF